MYKMLLKMFEFHGMSFLYGTKLWLKFIDTVNGLLQIDVGFLPLLLNDVGSRFT